MRALVLSIATLLACACSGPRQSAGVMHRPGDPAVMTASATDAAMNSAQAGARASLPAFITIVLPD